MPAIFDNILETAGHTPLVRMDRIARGLKGRIVAKLEGRNPAGSAKDRVGVAMIADAEARGILRPGGRDVTVVEPTSGNTGIALAMACAARGYPIALVMPDTMSVERRKILAGFGARLELTDGAKGMAGSIARAQEMKASDPDHVFIPQQFENPANPMAHFRTTGPEIWADADGKVDAFVAAVGTGGTFTGVARYLKSRNPALHAVAVEPSGSPVLSALKKGQAPVPGPHKLQGIGAGFLPKVMDLSLADQVMAVGDEEAMETARRLFTLEGVSCGISSGAAMAAALKLAARDDMDGKTIAVVLPDGGDRYLSTELFR